MLCERANGVVVSGGGETQSTALQVRGASALCVNKSFNIQRVQFTFHGDGQEAPDVNMRHWGAVSRSCDVEDLSRVCSGGLAVHVIREFLFTRSSCSSLSP